MNNTENQRKIDQLAAFFNEAKYITFLTGAGISTESGIPDFRSSNGIYAQITSEEIFDLASFARNPGKFYDFARRFFPETRKAQPNPAHLAIAQLEHEFGKTVHVCTQNIDSLHSQAGSSQVHHLHGTLETCTCRRCGQKENTETLNPKIEAGGVPRCHCGGVYKPDIVFFGEQLPEAAVDNSMQAMQEADLLIIAGTSLNVYPAAGLPNYRRPSCPVVIVNLSPTYLDNQAALCLPTQLGPTLSAAVSRLTGE